MESELKSRKSTEMVLVHFTGDEQTDYHQIKNKALQEGISEIGYHYIIERNGKLLMGRHQSKVGFHYPEYDEISIGICIAGERDDMTEPQSIALTLLLDKLRNDFPSVENIKYIYRTK